jgi:periplasmic mercuric ion binding protein
MKKMALFALVFTFFSTAVSAQTKAQLTAKISTPTVQCELCKKRIEEVLKRYDGVLTVNVNYRKKETTVKYLTDRTNEEIIKTAIANAGYDANEIAATKEAYDLLPKCCKKPADGGGKKQ